MRIGGAATEIELPRARDLRRTPHQRRTIRHQSRIRRAGAIPFDHREFGMVQRAAFAIAEHLGEFDDARLAGSQKLLAGEFRRGAQIELCRRAAGRQERGGESMEMGFIAGRYLQRPGLDLDKAVIGKPGPQARHDPGPRQQDRPAVGIDFRGPKGRGIGRFLRHGPCLNAFAKITTGCGRFAPRNQYVASRIRPHGPITG